MISLGIACIVYQMVLELDHLLWYHNVYCVASYIGLVVHVVWYCYCISLVIMSWDRMACRVVSWHSFWYFMRMSWMLYGSYCALYDTILAYHCSLFILVWLNIMWSRNLCIYRDLVCWHMAYDINKIPHISMPHHL